MLDALVEAANRGVRVAVLTPGPVDHNIVKPAGRREYGRLLQAGRSFALNDELNVIIYNPEVAADLERAFADDISHSKKVEYQEWLQRGMTERPLEITSAPFQDLL